MFGFTIVNDYNGKKWGVDVTEKDILDATGIATPVLARPGTVVGMSRSPGRVVVWLDKNDRVLSVRVG